MGIEETKPLVTKDQCRVSTKIVRDLSRYERKRHIAARIIARLKTDLADRDAVIEEQSDDIENLMGEITALKWVIEIKI